MKSIFLFSGKRMMPLGLVLILSFVLGFSACTDGGNKIPGDRVSPDPLVEDKPEMEMETGSQFVIGFDPTLRWISAPLSEITIYGGENHEFRFLTLGGKGTLDFELKVIQNHKDITKTQGFFTITSSTSQDVDEPRRVEEGGTGGQTMEEEAAARRSYQQLVEGGVLPEHPCPGSGDVCPPDPNVFTVKFEGVSQKDFTPGEPFATLEVTASDSEGKSIKKTVNIILTRPPEWSMTPAEGQIQKIPYMNTKTFNFGTRYGVGEVNLDISAANPSAFSIKELEGDSPSYTSVFELNFLGLENPDFDVWHLWDTIQVRATDSAGDSTTITFDLPIELECTGDPMSQYCYGAVGKQCGSQWLPEKTPVPEEFALFYLALQESTCNDGRCLISGGSWAHDTCCFYHPEGYMCPTDATLWGDKGDESFCKDEWDIAQSRVLQGPNWKRDVDFNKPNCQGEIVFEDYCARSGSLVHKDDAQYCCNKDLKATSLKCGLGDIKLLTTSGINPLICKDVRRCP